MWNQYRFYEAGGAPQWTDTACALLSHLTYRDRRRGRGPPSPSASAVFTLDPRLLHRHTFFIRYVEMRSAVSEGSKMCLKLACHSGRRLPIGGGKRNPFRHHYFYRAYESQLSNKYIRILSTSHLYKGHFTFILIFTRGAQPVSHERPK